MALQNGQSMKGEGCHHDDFQLGREGMISQSVGGLRDESG